MMYGEYKIATKLSSCGLFKFLLVLPQFEAAYEVLKLPHIKQKDPCKTAIEMAHFKLL